MSSYKEKKERKRTTSSLPFAARSRCFQQESARSEFVKRIMLGRGLRRSPTTRASLRGRGIVHNITKRKGAVYIKPFPPARRLFCHRRMILIIYRATGRTPVSIFSSPSVVGVEEADE